MTSYPKQYDKVQSKLELLKARHDECAEASKVTIDEMARTAGLVEEITVIKAKEDALFEAKAREYAALSERIEREMSEVVLALDRALADLKLVSKKDISDIRNMKGPPGGLLMTLQATCLLLGVVQNNVTGVNVSEDLAYGITLLNDWESALKSILSVEKDSIPEQVIEKIRPYLAKASFQPNVIAKQNLACSKICSWIHALHSYHIISKAMQPKRAVLAVLKSAMDKIQLHDLVQLRLQSKGKHYIM